ncbi:PREDICTED: HORMA domain-containing protein 1-like isoform X2 [Camelina sativa]|uniref:HORMA domain-containing protein 1-like isoform X2 n=1 Tax=Camelina sativa TaxID=90675 RepID=A0ABM0SS06_CAMSA|nr:PREDICTED: HORMA domain-containing protein 1-like isoform X2 [Camelina sativa]
MVVIQKLKEAEITEQDSLLLTRNLLRIAIFNISYIRGLFPEKYFNDKSVPALDMKIKKLMPMDAESRRLIDWMEKGVYDALQRKYLKTLMFCICETVDGPMIEEYAFSFSYSASDSQNVMMNINRTGSKKDGGTFNSTADITPNQMRSSACKMVRTLVQLMRTLDKMPDERTIVMKLLYYDDVTPPDYEPPFFRGCTEEEAQYVWTKNPLRMEIGNVNSKHLVLTLKVKSVLDPCEDENDDMQDDGKSIGHDSVHDEQPSDSDSEISQTQENQFIVVPVEKQDDDDGEVDEDDNTQDPAENEQQLARVKDWINSRHLDTLELTDILANFPDISIVLSEEIMDQLVKDGVLSKTGKDTYTKKKPESEFTFVKDEADDEIAPKKGKPVAPEDYLYMKALYHSLPMKYVTITKLHNMLDGEANQNAVRKLMDRMTQEGYVEASSNRRLGKRVIHSSLTEKKLYEVRKVFATDDMDVDDNEAIDKTNGKLAKGTGDVSTCGGIHSIGSDFTRTKGRSGMQPNGSVLSEQTISKAGNTPISNKAQPAVSRESFAVNGGDAKEAETANCSQASQDRRCRKTSMVREPILQYSKRQKSQAN